MKNSKTHPGAHARRLAMAALIATMMATSASAQTPALEGPAAPAGGHGLSAFIGGYDANRDGVVTRVEYDTVRKERFTTADANGDGSLDEQEYVAEFEGRLKQQYAGRTQDDSYAGSIKQAHVRFKILDTDKDGKLTIEEEIAIGGKTFKRTDTNGDGTVDNTDGDRK